jgi:hypothetical protein
MVVGGICVAANGLQRGRSLVGQGMLSAKKISA